MKTTLQLVFAAAIIMLIAACQGDGKTYAMIETDLGNMKVELYNSTPIHKENFIKLANEGFYDSLLFHRVIGGFMIQGGDPQSKNAGPNQRLGSGGPGYKLDAEIGSPHFKGTLAAARQGGSQNPLKKSSGSQFYIVQGKTYTEASLQNLARTKGVSYNEAQIKKYETLGGTPQLDMDYTVFGEVVEGMDVIDKIAQAKTNPLDRPLEDIRMKVYMVN